MDCFDLQALGSDSSTLSSNDVSSSSQDELVEFSDKNQMSDVEMIQVVDEAEVRKQKREDIFVRYKEGLKAFGLGNLSEAEETFQTLLDNSLIEEINVDRDEQQAANTTPPEHDQDLMRLKYVLYKNLSTIHRKQNFNYTKALDFLIQAAKIDDTDRCVWYEIGENALHLNKHMIARYAFEQTLSIDPGDWFSLDNLVVILYALGNYSHCLNYVIQSLKLDKFYVNGLIAMKLLTKLNDSYLDKQIEMFVEGAYTMCGIELDSYLSQLDEELYDSFMTRVESIKGSHKRQLFEICNNQGEFQSHELNLEVKVTNKIYSWESLGNFITALNETNQNIQLPIHFTFENEAKGEEKMADAESSNQEKTNDLEMVTAISNKKSKRKIKFEQPMIDDGTVRRSSRKNDKIDQSDNQEALIYDIIKEFFGESAMNRNVEEEFAPSEKKAKKSTDKTSGKVSLVSLKESEKASVAEFVDLMKRDICMFDLVKCFLKEISLNYDKVWYGSVEEIFVNLYESFNKQYDLVNALEQEDDPTEFLEICSIVLTRLEIEFSKCKTLQDLRKKLLRSSSKKGDALVLEPPVEVSASQIGKLMLTLQELDYAVEKVRNKLSGIKFCNKNEKLIEASKYFLIRTSGLFLYASLNLCSEFHSSEFYFEKLSELFVATGNRTVTVANSKIFQVLNKNEIDDFLKLSKKNNILQLNDQIRLMFEEEKFAEIIDEFADLDEIHFLQLDDPHFNTDIYIYLLNSYVSLNTPASMEKSDYYCRFYLKQVVKYLDFVLDNVFPVPVTPSNSNPVLSIDLTNSNSSHAHNPSTSQPALPESQDPKNSEVSPSQVANITAFIVDLLSILSKSLDFSVLSDLPVTSIVQANTDYSNQSNDSVDSTWVKIKQELVWIMYRIVSVYFDSNEFVAKFELKVRPMRTFIILFGLLPVAGSAENRIEYLSLVHDYLARYGICNSNEGELLSWLVNTLIEMKSQCSTCNCAINVESATQRTTVSDDLPVAVAATDKSSKPNAIKCTTCSDMDKLLDQSFYCLFGYKKRTLRFLENHTCGKLAYTVENSVNVFNYYKPSKMPEYDDLPKNSIPTEFNDFLCELLKLIQVNDESLINTRNRFMARFGKENYSEIDTFLDSISNTSDLEKTVFKDMYFLMGDYHFKSGKDYDKRDDMILNFLIKDLTINKKRFDGWTELALFTSAKILSDFPETV